MNMAQGVIGRLLRLLIPLVYRARKAGWFVFRPVTMGVRVLVIEADQLLLVRGHAGNTWHLPGGAVSRGETLAQAAQREALEETGSTVEIGRLLGMYSNTSEYKSDHVAIFAGRMCSPLALKFNVEIVEARFFPLAALPANLAAYVRPRLADYLAGEWGICGTW